MPIHAFLFGGRRADGGAARARVRGTGSTARSLGVIMSSDGTTAASGGGAQAAFQSDGDAAVLAATTWATTSATAALAVGSKGDAAKLPKIFDVNWFRKDDDGKSLRPGFGENSRVLEPVFRRCDGEGEAVETPIGLVPAEGAVDTSGLDISDDAMSRALDRGPEGA